MTPRASLLSTENLNRVVEIGDETVTVEAGIRYGDLSSALESHGLALPNLASLPHVSVGGAIATGTHGSGARNQSLSAGIASLELVCADGSISRLRRGDEDFDGAVVSLGALGLVTRVSLDVVPAFELRQYVFEQLPWSTVEADLDAILEGAYSVSLFTMLGRAGDRPGLGEDDGAAGLAVVVLRRGARNSNRVTRFRGRTRRTAPSNWAYPAPRASGSRTSASASLPAAAPSSSRSTSWRASTAPTPFGSCDASAGAVSPLLLTSEIRTIAADTLWLSPFYEQDSIAFHFTWKPRLDDVLTVLPQIESALEPFGAATALGEAVRSVSGRPRSCLPEAAGLSAASAEARRRRQVPQRVRRALRVG